MLSTVLAEYPWLTTVALAGMLVLGPMAGAWLTRRPRVTRMLFGLSILLVALATLLPEDRELTIGCTFAWDFPRPAAIELMANLLLCVPVALLAGILTQRPLLALLAVSAGSLLIETIQAFATVLGRSCSTNDWLANTLGALLGTALATAALRLRSHLRERSRDG